MLQACFTLSRFTCGCAICIKVKSLYHNQGRIGTRQFPNSPLDLTSIDCLVAFPIGHVVVSRCSGLTLSCINTSRFPIYVSSVFNVMHERASNHFFKFTLSNQVKDKTPQSKSRFLIEFSINLLIFHKLCCDRQNHFSHCLLNQAKKNQEKWL